MFSMLGDALLPQGRGEGGREGILTKRSSPP